MKFTTIKLTLVLIFFGMLSCSETIKKPTTNVDEKIPSSTLEIPAKPEAWSEATIPVFHKSHEPKKQDAPFSDAVQVGNTFYLSGQIGMDHTTRELVEGGIETETKLTLENIKAVLAQHNLKMTDVVKALVVLDDIEDFKAFNEIYKTYFPQKPARTTFAAQALARGAKIEIEVIAIGQ